MSTYYFRQGNRYTFTDQANVNIEDRLPPGNFTVKEDQFGNLYLERIDNFTFTGKRYGENPTQTKRILDTFGSREFSTGVMLAGQKGSGKSLLAKTVSIEGYELGYPTIVINTPFSGEQFNTFIQDIDQPAIILFDEFEKVYDSDRQESILTLLDGVYPSKKLFIFTCNDKWRVDTHMRNRPGRIYYMLEFGGISEDFIREYCQDNLKNLEHIEKLVSISNAFSSFSFDMMKAMVEEMNRYGEEPSEVLEVLNIKPEFSDSSKYKVDLNVKTDLKIKHVDEFWCGNPLAGTVRIEFYASSTKNSNTQTTGISETGDFDISDDDDGRWTNATFSPNQIVSLGNGQVVYDNGEGSLLRLSKVNEDTRFVF